VTVVDALAKITQGSFEVSLSGEVFWIWHSHHEKSIIPNEISFPSHIHPASITSRVIHTVPCRCFVSGGKPFQEEMRWRESLMVKHCFQRYDTMLKKSSVLCQIKDTGYRRTVKGGSKTISWSIAVPESSCERGFWPSNIGGQRMTPKNYLESCQVLSSSVAVRSVVVLKQHCIISPF